MPKVFYLIVLLIFSSAFSQENKNQERDALKSQAVTSFREIFWNNPRKHQGWVTDYERLYTSDQDKELNKAISEFEKETSIEIVIVTLDTLRVSGENFNALALRMAQSWGIGKPGKDNGILIAISKAHRQMRIENGNGIAKMLTDDETQEIIDQYFIPKFREGAYFEGTQEGLKELMRKLKAKIKIRF